MMEIFDLESETHLSECRKKAFAFITLFIIILSTYSNTFHASWHFDDLPNIVENRALHLKSLSWPNIKKSFFSLPDPYRALYRPVACLSLALNYYFGKDNVLGYHIVNISIHMITAFFLFLFIYHSLNLPLLRARYGNNSYFIALLSTILWAINPIQTQAITYIVQRMASMAGMFFIMAMYFYLKAQRVTQNPSKIILFLLCAISTLLAFGSKENAIMIPATLFLYDFLLIQGVSRENTKKNLKAFLVAAVVTLSIGFIYYTLSEATFSSSFDLYSKRPFTLWERLMTQPRIIVFYISLILYPMSTRLSADHDIAISNSLFDPFNTILSILLIIGIVIGAIFLSKKRPFISFSILFFFLNHIVESSILPLELIFEHRNYIPSMLFFVPIAIGIIRAISYFSYKRSMQAIITISIILVLIGEGHATFMRNFTWKTEESLWIDCMEKYPELFRAHHNLAKYYGDHNQEEKAIKGYETALECKTIHNKIEKSVTFYNMGIIYFQRKEYEKAKKCFLEAIKIDPCYRGAHNNLAVLLAINAKEHQEVLDELKKDIVCNPEGNQAYANMGLILIKMGRFDQGIQYLEKALDLEPNNVAALERLGYVYMKKGLLGKASIFFKKAFNQRPKNIRALLYLAELYTRGGHKKKARESISLFLNFVQYADLGPLLDKLLGEKSLLKITPDMNMVLHLLSKAYEQKLVSLKMSSDFLNALKNNTHDRKGK